jgi:5-methylcytosine-specific restriction protein B
MLSNIGKVRNLSASEFGVSARTTSVASSVNMDNQSEVGGKSGASVNLIDDDDQLYGRVLELLNDGFAGIIFSGSPGTGKSWYARQIAIKLTSGNEENQFFVQFHPGYQYEDFIEGFVPDAGGGFRQELKIFLRACEQADKVQENVIIVIDELSRTDTVRVFGEVLTYLEKSKRGIPFTLASGRTVKIPSNLIVLGTMNPWDRGVDELDLAFERRFAKIRIDPNAEKLKELVNEDILGPQLMSKFVQFFHMLANHKNPLCRIGQAYFCNIVSVESLRRVWDNQLMFHFEKVLRHDDEQLAEIKAAWKRIFES